MMGGVSQLASPLHAFSLAVPVVPMEIYKRLLFPSNREGICATVLCT
jgi:hypothetical protein